MFEFVYRVKKEKKGTIPIDIIVSVFTIIFVWFFIIQVIEYDSGASYISQANSYITRTIGVQGGIRNYIPNGWKEGKNYTTASELYSNISLGFKNAGFTKWSVYINDELFANESSLYFREKAYPKHTKIVIQIKASMPSVLKFKGQKNEMVRSSQRICYSAFEERKDITQELITEGL